MIVYKGPSQLDGKPVVAIVTGVNSKSSNSKTGDMPQVWILRDDIHPTEALRIGGDGSVCGSCPLRPQVLGEGALKKTSRQCYVNTMSFNAVYRTYRLGKYEELNPKQAAKKLNNRKVRLGAYGDPAAVPIQIWDDLLTNCTSTGYTHQWRNVSPRYADYCMASCDTEIDVMEATQRGYRVFYVQINPLNKRVGGIKLSHCPASKEMGKRTTCEQCMVCSGNRSGLKSQVTILKH